MSIRIFSAAFAAVWLCVTLPASADIRPEIARRLELAQHLADHYSLGAAFVQMEAVNDIKNETDEEKQAIAKMRAYVNSKRPGYRAGFYDTFQDEIGRPPQPPPPPPPPP